MAPNGFEGFDTLLLEKILSILRHEMGNTVNSAMLTLEILQNEVNSLKQEREKDYILRLQKILMQQHRMVMALKSFASVSTAKVQRISIHDFWDQLRIDTLQLIDEEKITFSHHIHTQSIHVMANPHSLRFIMGHLLNNAIESVKNVQAPHIRFDCFQQSNLCILQLKDNGKGIPPHEQTDIFLPLYSKKPGHDGMGLCLSLKLALEMQGKIRVSSRPNEGACFQLQLNCAE
jgi:two-component system C4-dicarboxylate transport sensor histidine kinase DctB